MTPPLPVVQEETTYYVYDQQTGAIVLTQRHIVMQGSPAPDKDRMANVLRRRTAFLANKPIEHLAVLHLAEGPETSRNPIERVDIKTKTLVRRAVSAGILKP